MATKSKKDKFADMGRQILNPEKPHDLESFLADDEQDTKSRKTGNTEIRTKKPKTQKIVREEFRLPVDLSEKLRKYAFEKRMSKTAVVIEALYSYLNK